MIPQLKWFFSNVPWVFDGSLSCATDSHMVTHTQAALIQIDLRGTTATHRRVPLLLHTCFASYPASAGVPTGSTYFPRAVFLVGVHVVRRMLVDWRDTGVRPYRE